MPMVWTTRPMAPAATSSVALVTQGTSKRSEKLTDQMRLVRKTVSRSCASWASVVHPGLSVITSLPASMALMARSARFLGISAIRIRSIVGSASTSSTLFSRDTAGNRSTNPSSNTGSPCAHQPANSAPVSIMLCDIPKICRCSMPRAANLMGLVIVPFPFAAPETSPVFPVRIIASLPTPRCN